MTPDGVLRRELGVFGATLLGLGSILGTGVFVSLGLAAGVTGSSVVPAIVVAAFVAFCNALSSAQLAASHPTSGGTYEYGHVYLTPTLGFAAGWMFLCAKSASAATAALGVSGYALTTLGIELPAMPLALLIVVAMTWLVSSGLRRSNVVNTIVVGITLVALSAFVVSTAALLPPTDQASSHGTTGPRFLEATALIFVAFTGYGRVATLGEEVRDPRRTIPIAILTTLGVSAALYLAVGWVTISRFGAPLFASVTASHAAPLASLSVSSVSGLVALGAVTAMLGVLLNLLLGLSRVALSMGRRGDLPARIARVDEARSTPAVAVRFVGGIAAVLVLFGALKLAWSLSAFTVLLYYALTNLAALRLPEADRRYPRVFAWLGLAGCLSLAPWVEPRAWIAGLAILATGLVGRALLRSDAR